MAVAISKGTHEAWRMRMHIWRACAHALSYAHVVSCTAPHAVSMWSTACALYDESDALLPGKLVRYCAIKALRISSHDPTTMMTRVKLNQVACHAVSYLVHMEGAYGGMSAGQGMH